MPRLTDSQRVRLADVAQAARDAAETATVHRHLLEDAVLHAVDVDQVPAREVAAAVGVSPTRIYAIIRNAYKR